ncbi:CaiB/BaiF CoA transferase family protein [Aspergillus aculeatinus CBS 121060]|uniref:CoA-transferase family III n=1 Tax=Aspergillus aculeatinus CBS 121060 TaxID=1448322 RepID=A0ACD1H3G7_9EURO|nr:CoA-transferase family III [Aspergillus aculeatinus CBS 121060]RAH68113.1 CoA-transferase family III [Aspergillus aculeatinus CBS 121060]
MPPFQNTSRTLRTLRTLRTHQPLSVRRLTTPASRQPGPLTGITVVSLEQAIAAPFCTRQLADLGARVIKVERPGVGDFARDYDTRVNGLASHFVWTNRSKESLALDLKEPRDHRVLMQLLRKADVLVQNLAPGASGRLRLSYPDLKTTHPSLIVCNISGYGSNGPYRDKKAYDLLIQSEAGMLSVTGTAAGEPAKVGISIADIAAGSYAYSSILAALYRRERDPAQRGGELDISMLEAMVEWMGFPLYYTYGNAAGPKPAGASHAAIYPYGPFEAGDGKSVMLGIQNEREWARFCGLVLRQPQLAEDDRFKNNSLRVKNRDALQRIINDAFSELSAEQAVARLDEAAIANARVNDMQGVWEHPQLKARNRWTSVATPAGTVPALVPPGMSLDDSEAFYVRMDAVPDVGEHNEAILAELGIERE